MEKNVPRTRLGADSKQELSRTSCCKLSYFRLKIGKQNNLDSASTGSFLVFAQVNQQLTETFLARSTGTASGTFARHIDQLGNTLPAGAAGGGVFTIGQELFSLGTGLGTVFVCLIVIGNIEVVNVLASLLDGRFLLLIRNLCATGNLGVSFFAPFPIVLPKEIVS